MPFTPALAETRPILTAPVVIWLTTLFLRRLLRGRGLKAAEFGSGSSMQAARARQQELLAEAAARRVGVAWREWWAARGRVVVGGGRCVEVLEWVPRAWRGGGGVLRRRGGPPVVHCSTVMELHRPPLSRAQLAHLID